MSTGLGLPGRETIGTAYGTKTFVVTPNTSLNEDFLNLLNERGAVFSQRKLTLCELIAQD